MNYKEKYIYNLYSRIKKLQVGGIVYESRLNPNIRKKSFIDFNEEQLGYLSTPQSDSTTVTKTQSESFPEIKMNLTDATPQTEITKTDAEVIPAQVLKLQVGPADTTTTSSKSQEVVSQSTSETIPETRTSIKLVGKEGFKQLTKLYENALAKRGIPLVYAKWLASKDALETGWGKHSKGLDYFNYGNIIAGPKWKGKTYMGTDHDAEGNKINVKFRAYDSLEEYIEDQLNLFTLSRYKNLFEGDPAGFAKRLKEAGYAVGNNYDQSVENVYHSW